MIFLHERNALLDRLIIKSPIYFKYMGLSLDSIYEVLYFTENPLENRIDMLRMISEVEFFADFFF